jgi:hypothetical protein
VKKKPSPLVPFIILLMLIGLQGYSVIARAGEVVCSVESAIAHLYGQR